MASSIPFWNTLTGIEFNALTKKLLIIPYKLTNEKEIHRNFQYKTGLNIDTLQFIGYINYPGLYFTDSDNFVTWQDNFAKSQPLIHKRKVIIPDDARVYVEYQLFKTDKFILEEKELINSSNLVDPFFDTKRPDKFPRFGNLSGKQFNELSNDKWYRIEMIPNIKEAKNKKYEICKNCSVHEDFYLINEKSVEENIKLYRSHNCTCGRKVYKQLVTIFDDSIITTEFHRIKASGNITLGKKEEI